MVQNISIHKLVSKSETSTISSKQNKKYILSLLKRKVSGFFVKNPLIIYNILLSTGGLLSVLMAGIATKETYDQFNLDDKGQVGSARYI